jgi:hypothetical protein
MAYDSTTPGKRRFRIRPCGGNKSAWCLTLLRADGTEIDSNGGWTTAFSVDALLRTPHEYLRPQPGDSVELVLA